MTHFVLSAGRVGVGRGGGRAARAGDHARPVTLSGLAEKHALPAGPRTHAENVVAEVERLGARDVVLVGHSYSDHPVGQVAERIGDRVGRVAYVDASVPFDGEDSLSGRPGDPVRAAIEEHGGLWPVPAAEEFAGQGLTNAHIARFLAKGTPHPGATLTVPAEPKGSPGDVPATYVKCLLDRDVPPPAVAGPVEGGRWELVEVDTGHWPMFSQPRVPARVLHESAAAD
ncbi:alpha/beta fold hydrolase [Streptomyces antibioticus]|uniref:alpha/beta fold hydrolase n=1 Tax=Streptomyces antibioticus TaxID=1890 RepID=UPI00371F55C9